MSQQCWQTDTTANKSMRTVNSDQGTETRGKSHARVVSVSRRHSSVSGHGEHEGPQYACQRRASVGSRPKGNPPRSPGPRLLPRPASLPRQPCPGLFPRGCLHPAQAHAPADTEKPSTPWGLVLTAENPKHHPPRSAGCGDGLPASPPGVPLVVGGSRRRWRRPPARVSDRPSGHGGRRWAVGRPTLGL